MKIIDLTDEHKNLYFKCLEDWSDEMNEAGNHKECWYNKIKDKGLRVKLALDDNDNIGGMIQYVPIEYSFAEGKDLYFINCIWVHGHKKGRGNFQKKGMGKALLNAAEEDAKQLGASGIAAWGLSIPVFIRASWFKKHGYIKADKMGMQLLVWKAFKDDAVPPKWIKKKKLPEPESGKVTVTAFINGWCPVMSIAYERALKAASEFGDKVEFKSVNTFDRETFLSWGISDALFVDGKGIRIGPPPSYKKIKRKIAKRVKKQD